MSVVKSSACPVVEVPSLLDFIRLPNECLDFLKNGDDCLGSLAETHHFTGLYKIDQKRKTSSRFSCFHLVLIRLHYYAVKMGGRGGLLCKKTAQKSSALLDTYDQKFYDDVK